jgi:glutamate synthase domain-containing protein 1
MADNKLIYDLLKEMREDQKQQGEKQSEQGEELVKQRVCLDNVRKDIKKIQEDVAENKEDWRTHMKRTDVLEQLHKDNQKRIEELEVQSKKKDERIRKLERPVIAKAWLKENVKWVLTISALGAGLVTKILEWW